MAMATSASALILPRLPMAPTMPARASPAATMPRRIRGTRPLRAACAYALQEGQSRRSHRLPCGLDLEVIAQQPPTPAPGRGRSDRPPLVFLHGSFHAAWCWAEHWLPFFSRAGFPCFALSLRAQGESSIPSEAVAGTLETHSGDIADFIRKEVPDSPVLIGHSFGGLIVQHYISCLQDSEPLHPKLSGAVLVCSVPPSGNSGLVWRYLLTKPIAAVKVTLSLAAKAYAKSLPLCKETFFSPQMDDELVMRASTISWCSGIAASTARISAKHPACGIMDARHVGNLSASLSKSGWKVSANRRLTDRGIPTRKVVSLNITAIRIGVRCTTERVITGTKV